MKFYSKYIFIFLTGFLMISCGDETGTNEKEAAVSENPGAGAEKASAKSTEVMISQQQFDALDIKIDTLATRSMSGFVEANGHLEVPPQSEATVTTSLGANIASIEVIEGDNVKKGQVLAYISHPDIVEIQTRFLNMANEKEFQEKEYNRQQKLYEAGVGSGEGFQKAEAAYRNAKGNLQGLKAQLSLLNLNPQAILNGNLAQRVPLKSPIAGAVQKVNIKTGQYVQAQQNLFEIVNTEHVHADLMVFERDVALVEEGQQVNFTVESLPGTELQAKILSIGKTFEEDPKALHIHAEIEDKPKNLIPGMYVRGRIAVEDNGTMAMPEDAIATNGGRSYVFSAEEEGEAWSFKPVEVITGTRDNEWVEVSFVSKPEAGLKFAFNNAYYLMAEMQKREGGHHH
ncbi:efflux RND transporter periplasmic adaptor subunit [Zunongwangia sp. F363]|uniref:Efflux RND transporter periplasmic adaptor subunit n=1 Tax=Autumnicola tepida TaxID=3075595 RepID=A0ABU3C8L3_9FLAO|nr:efflux RND transporter periplasmic adaptor subunit [Zunongwangia sp. F363]MDT0642659.1 efflux RND transporter periplasmic adaptor subunit [Zunongwangia sp. F363]